jgi:hypothetical protein
MREEDPLREVGWQGRVLLRFASPSWERPQAQRRVSGK